ncbi:MAG: hypothetical protein RLZZ214_24, partial [Verrucomicrobiota bacterium]
MRWWLLLAVVAVVVALFMAMGDSGSRKPVEAGPADGAKPGVVREGGDDLPPVPGQAGLAPPRATRSSLNRAATEGEPQASQFPQVERLLLDESL